MPSSGQSRRYSVGKTSESRSTGQPCDLEYRSASTRLSGCEEHNGLTHQAVRQCAPYSSCKHKRTTQRRVMAHPTGQIVG